MTDLRVATANAASGRTGLGSARDLPGWAASAASLDVDVLAVQEVDHLLPRSGSADQTAEIAAACAGTGPAWSSRFAAAVHGTPGRSTTMRPAPATLPHEPSYGIALLSRYAVRNWHELRMAPARFVVPVPDEQRAALAAEVVTPGGAVTVVATHLSFAPLRAAVQLRELVAWAADLPRPLVLLGDLNLPGRLPARLTGWTPGVSAATYPASRPVVQLDHVLLDAGGTGARLIDGQARTVGRSDHLGLRAELVLDG
ncbi:endonuclease/exonuclease/phosphatase family protein [Nocardioides houyundeii]|uniref:endonuclease/exonuclease/phosphatase family protein n=1 Tax=Nocardioides houyundeii TaxID=2045452 RepID=UPI0018F02B4A|nr:endonuclease/exonuclease/phosphatase family protein [Nocardioides houyundeii]